MSAERKLTALSVAGNFAGEAYILHDDSGHVEEAFTEEVNIEVHIADCILNELENAKNKESQ